MTDLINAQLSRLMEATSQILYTINPGDRLYLMLDQVLDQAVLQLDVDAVALFVSSPTGALEYLHGRGFRNGGFEYISLKSKWDIALDVLRQRRILSIPNLRHVGKNYSRPQMLVDEKFVSYHGAPLIATGNTQGILEVYSRKPHVPTAGWLDLFEVIARFVSLGLYNLGISGGNNEKTDVDLRVAYGATLDAWLAVMLLRGGEIGGHAKRVTQMTLRLARSIGIPYEQLGHITRGAMLHDIGKLAIPNRILQKPGPLSEKEWELMRKHPEFAYQLLSPIAHLELALPIPYSHHERWDGSGYPQGLQGIEIPLQVRIFSIVDVWDALCSDRPYRKAWADEDVFAYLRDQAGKHFDPRVVEIFLDLI